MTIYPVHPVPPRGAYRDRHGRGRGCGGRGSVRRGHQGQGGGPRKGAVRSGPKCWRTTLCGRRNREVPMPRVASSSFGEPLSTESGHILSWTRRRRKSVSAAGEQRHNPLTPSRAERRVVPGETVASLVCFLPHCARAHGCIGHPAFRTPSHRRGRQECSITRAISAAGSRALGYCGRFDPAAKRMQACGTRVPPKERDV